MTKSCDKCWGTGKAIDHERIGAWARKVRLGKGMTLLDMGRRLGISESELSLLERGKRGWGQKLYRRLMEL